MWCGGCEVWIRTLLTCAIGACLILGDYGLKYGKSESERAIFDNATHATIGGLTWMLIVVLSRKPLVRNLNSIFSCFLLASFIDVDHFIAARSWHIHVSNGCKLNRHFTPKISRAKLVITDNC